MFALLTRRGAAVALSASMLVASQGLAAPSLIMLPNLPNSFDMVPKAVSADGLTVVGDAYPNGSPRAFRWSAAGGIEDLGAFPDAVSSVRAVSADGRVVVGTSGGKAFRWVEGSGMHELGTPANAFGSPATGVSADGQVVCGWVWFPAQLGTSSYRWTQAQGLEYLPMFSGSTYLAAAGISADGLVIVGAGTIDDRGRAFRWETSTGTVDLGLFPMGFFSGAYATSADGAVVIGLSSSNELLTRGFVWTQENGMVPMSMLPGSATSQPRAMSSDGTVVVGQSYWESTSRYAATMWAPSLGAIDLNEYLPSIGVNLGTFTLEDAVGISGDGTAIAGRGRVGTSSPRTWFVSGLESTLPPCIGDSTGDRAVTFADITSALGNWGRAYAFPFGPGDCDGSRMVDMGDVTTVLMHFGEVCR
jgi:probable HAF family extracellular repeat protein